MSSDSNDFEALRKLVALKRYEQPPPGYFNRLPDKIILRIEQGDGQMGFWGRWLEQFTFHPALACSCAMAALTALTVSFVYSIRLQPGETAQVPPQNGWRSATPEEAFARQYDPSQPLHVPNWIGSDNVSNPAPFMPSSFGPTARPVPVSFASPP